MTRSRQSEHQQEASLRRLAAMIPHECPLTVRRLEYTGFVVSTLDGLSGHAGRFQVVAAWIDGYLTAWRERV